MSKLQTPPPLEKSCQTFDSGEHQGQPLNRAWDLLRDGDLVIDALILENMEKKNHKQNWHLGRTGLSNVQYNSTSHFLQMDSIQFPARQEDFILSLIKLW